MKQAFLTLVAASIFAPLPSQAQQITILAASDYVWETTPEGVAFAALQGDRFAEPYQALVRLPGGTISPPHVKSATMSGILLQGEMVHYAEGDDPDAAKTIGAGAFYRISGGVAHISACVSETPCVAYLYQDGRFDFLPVKQ